MSSTGPRFPVKLPTQVAAICYRRTQRGVEFLLVNTNGGLKWTFPKGATDPRLSHSQAAEREAWEEAGAVGEIEPQHFHIFLYSKGLFWKKNGVQEFPVKAYLMEVQHLRRAPEALRNPTWFSPPKARKMLAKRREVKYGQELADVIDRAMERLLRIYDPAAARLRLRSATEPAAQPPGY
jgi:8-oxo-dGTP pyrophosphatase MutT (NUDIX family)